MGGKEAEFEGSIFKFVDYLLPAQVWFCYYSAQQASLSFTISQSLRKLMSIALMMLCNHLTLCSFCLQSFPPSESFPMSWLFTSGGQSIFWCPLNEFFFLCCTFQLQNFILVPFYNFYFFNDIWIFCTLFSRLHPCFF